MAQMIPEDGPRKPRIGQDCNGCGICCVAEPCAVALEYADGAERAANGGQACPALEWDDGRSWCGMVRRPLIHSEVLRREFGDLTPTQLDVAQIVMGRMFRDMLGDGDCDSGPAIHFLPDEWAGCTALEFVAAGVDA